MLSYLLFLSLSLANVCTKSTDSAVEVSMNILKIASQTRCPTCPYSDVSEDVILTKDFNRKTADRIMDELMTTIQQVVSDRSNLQPECPPPCKSRHKSLSLIKISPKAINIRVQCPQQSQKSYTLTKKFQATGNKNNCNTKVNDSAAEWIEDTLVTPSIPLLSIKATPEGKDLYNKCPSGCSYYSTQVFDHTFGESSCSLDLTLIVDCGPPKLEAEFIGKGVVRDHLVCTK